MPTYLTLAYDGNYVGKTSGGHFLLFTYKENLYVVDPDTDTVAMF
jgi:hypothetical protein